MHSNSQNSPSSAKYFLFLREMRKLHLTETECARHVSQRVCPTRPRLPTRAHIRDSGSQTEILLDLATGSSSLSAVGHHGAAIWDERYVLGRVSFSPLGPGPGERPYFSSPIKSFTALASHSFSIESGEQNILLNIYCTPNRPNTQTKRQKFNVYKT